MRLSDFVPPLGGSRPLDPAIHPRNFALLIFGREPTRFFPGAWTKVSFYPRKDRSEQTAERHEITGTVVGQAKKALDLLKTHASTAYDKESPEPNAPKYPERALQEAVINAIVHRDYEQPEPTSITVFEVVTCVLPAHPRHELMRHVSEIERLIIQQDYDGAQAKLKPLLDEKPTNPRLLEFLRIIEHHSR